MIGIHIEIKLSFLLVGHTKFAPDWCFGLFKQLLKRQEWGPSMTYIAEVAEKSAVVNHAQLIGDHDGSIHVPMCNWAEFFEDHAIQTALKGIPHMHHFRFTAAHRGAIFVRIECLWWQRKKNKYIKVDHMEANTHNFTYMHHSTWPVTRMIGLFIQ